MTRVVGLSVILGIVAILTGGCSASRPAQAASPSVNTPTAPTTSPPVDSGFIASGPLVVENQVDVIAQREGVVIKTMAEPGTRVGARQMLAQLDDRQIAADLDAARANVRKIEFNLQNWEADLKALQSDLDRSQKMWDALLITKQQLEHDQYKVAADEFQVQRERQALRQAASTARSLELELEKTRIRAPFAGLVARRYVRVGQRVASGDRMFWVTAVAPLRVRFTLPERFLGSISKGEELEFTSPDIPGGKRQAKVIEFSPVVDPSSGTIEVLAEVVGPAGELRPGMMTDIRMDNPR